MSTPFQYFTGKEYRPTEELRDYFAAQALRVTLGASTDKDGWCDFTGAAVAAYQAADAMLAAREQGATHG
jgi:hypothetical protein